MDWHHAHNLSLLASAYQYEGQLRKAELYFREEGQLTPFTEYAAFSRKDWPEFLLNRGDFPRALEASEQMTRSRSAMARAAGHALAAAALAAMHRPEKASTQFNAAKTEAQKLNRPDAGSVSPYLDISALAILLARGPISDAPPVVQRIERYVRAATSADSWSQGLFRVELLANLARAYDHWEVAGELSDFMLSVDPYYGGSHYAKAVVARHNQDLETARLEFTAAERYWNHADKELPDLVDSQNALSAPGRPTPKIP
jgi:tetratricopeptide (TPR) repeat protein